MPFGLRLNPLQFPREHTRDAKLCGRQAGSHSERTPVIPSAPLSFRAKRGISPFANRPYYEGEEARRSAARM